MKIKLLLESPTALEEKTWILERNLDIKQNYRNDKCIF